MNLANCPKCGRIFQQRAHRLCPHCVKQLDEEYNIVYHYLRKNKGATMFDLEQATGVPLSHIVQFIKEGKISIKNNPNIAYPCNYCGKPTREGNLCPYCKSQLGEIKAKIEEDKKLGRGNFADNTYKTNKF